PKAKRGRKAGTPNFKPREIKKLLTILRNRLPAGGKGWSQVSTDYNGWAKRKGLPECDQWSLEAKYKAILKTKKPTGSASRPAFVTDALEVEDLINQHVGARHDNDILSILSDSSDSDSDSNSDNDGPAVTAVARCAPSPPLRGRKPCTSGPELVNTIVYALGPEASKAREDARNKCSYENTHIFSLSQQLDRLQTKNSALCTQVSDLQRALDRTELCLEFQTTALDNNSCRHSHHPRRHGRVHGDTKKDTYYNFQRVHGRIRVEEKFPDGGAQMTWVTDVSEDASESSDFDYCNMAGPPSAPLRRSPSYIAPSPCRRRSPTPGPSNLSPADKASLPTVGGKGAELIITPWRGAPIGCFTKPFFTHF
ncbi:hypothetical protein C8F01DRAFT_1001006, partial [Mycena amicta]